MKQIWFYGLWLCFNPGLGGGEIRGYTPPGPIYYILLLYTLYNK
jgi:hypothetical protein